MILGDQYSLHDYHNIYMSVAFHKLKGSCNAVYLTLGETYNIRVYFRISLKRGKSIVANFKRGQIQINAILNIGKANAKGGKSIPREEGGGQKHPLLP